MNDPFMSRVDVTVVAVDARGQRDRPRFRLARGVEYRARLDALEVEAAGAVKQLFVITNVTMPDGIVV